jgi:hypothetical protein
MFSFFKKKKTMFKNITINLDGPICRCKDMNLTFGITVDMDYSCRFIVQCKDCRVTISVPYNALKGNFKLDKPYNGDDGGGNEDSNVIKLFH